MGPSRRGFFGQFAGAIGAASLVLVGVRQATAESVLGLIPGLKPPVDLPPLDVPPVPQQPPEPARLYVVTYQDYRHDEYDGLAEPVGAGNELAHHLVYQNREAAEAECRRLSIMDLRHIGDLAAYMGYHGDVTEITELSAEEFTQRYKDIFGEMLTEHQEYYGEWYVPEEATDEQLGQLLDILYIDLYFVSTLQFADAQEEKHQQA